MLHYFQKNIVNPNKNVTLEALCIECILHCAVKIKFCSAKCTFFFVCHTCSDCRGVDTFLQRRTVELCFDARCAEDSGRGNGSKDYDQWLAPRHDYIMSTRHALNKSADMCLTQMYMDQYRESRDGVSGSFL